MNTNQKIKQLEEELKILKAKNKDLCPNGDPWVIVDIPTLKEYGVKPFQIQKRKMRKDDKVWNNINFYDAKKEAEKLGYRLPDMREILALLEYYKQKNKKVSENDEEFLGIEELSYKEDVCYEWVAGANCAFRRGGGWDNGASAGAFTLALSHSPGLTTTTFGFRCARCSFRRRRNNVLDS